jgi:formylglycine-generating enzyme required for sulfatase activity
MNSKDKVLRGVCWNYYPGLARADYRDRYHPEYRSNYRGFRLVQDSPGKKRVLRGGTWIDIPDIARADYRFKGHTEIRNFLSVLRGFRLVQEK